MTPLSIATDGFLNKPIGIASSGYLCILVVITPPSTGGGGGNRLSYGTYFSPRKKNTVIDLTEINEQYDEEQVIAFVLSEIYRLGIF